MEKTKIVSSNMLEMNTENLSQNIIFELKSCAQLFNPRWIECQKYGYGTRNVEQVLKFFKHEDDILTMPRGTINGVLNIFRRHGVDFEITDNTRMLPAVDFCFNGNLHEHQKKAVSAALQYNLGVVEAPTASGKTIMALNIIAQRRQPVLIVVHTRELLMQWRERAKTFLGLQDDEIGKISAGKKTIGKLTIATVQSLAKCVDEVKCNFGFAIIDECHRAPAKQFALTVKKLDYRYLLGLSATAFRRDKLTQVIHFHLGDTIHKISPIELQQKGKIIKAELRARETEFTYHYADDYTNMISEMIENYTRNEMIIADVNFEISSKRQALALVVSDRRAHCETLFTMLQDRGVNARLLTGAMSNKERQKIIDQLNNDQNIKVLVSTVQLIGEGFDMQRLSSIFLATPIKFQGRIIQTFGRIIRACDGKDSALIYDYVDSVGVLEASFRSRLRGYKSQNVTMVETQYMNELEHEY